MILKRRTNSASSRARIGIYEVDQIQKQIRETRKAMEVAAKDLDFVEAARLRDLMKSFQDHLKA